MTTACPSRQQLLDYAVGKLDEPTLDEVSLHVDQCGTCQSLLATLDDSGDTVLSRLRSAPVAMGFEHEPEYQQAVAAAKAVVAGAAAVIAPSAARVGSSGSDEDDRTAPLETEAVEQLAGVAESPAGDSPAQELPELGDYELLDKLGEGGMGAVYKARHKKLKRIMAIKLLPKERLANPTALARFEREMEAVGAVDHPNIVRAMHAGEYEGTPYLAVEYVDGLNLSDLVTRVGPLRIPDACELVRQTAVGLQHAYEQGLVHRDIKPSNLMLSVVRSPLSVAADRAPRMTHHGQLTTDHGQQAIVKILDLGLALLDSGRPPGREMTSAGTAMGTADYVSPEQVNDSHSVDIRSDIYSLGCTLYKLLSGQAPFVGPEYKNEFHKMMAHVQKSPPPISLLRTDLPPELTAIIQRMMAKEPGDRFATPAEVAAALAPLAAGADLPALLAEATGLAAATRTEAPRTASTGPLSASPHTDTGPAVGARRPPVAPDRRAGVEAVPAVPMPSEPQPSVSPSPAARPAFGARRPLAIALAALAGLILLGVILLRVKTPAGTIILEVDQLEIAGAVVEVDGQQRVTIDPGQGLEKVTVAADEKEHVLRVTKGGFETFTRKFTLKAGQSQTITVRLEPLAAPATHVAESLRDSKPVSKRPGYVGVPPREEKPEPKPTPLTQPPVKTETVARSAPPHAEREGYVADATWTPGPLYNVLRGFIPRPAKLPGVNRWQAISVAPRDQILSVDWSSTGLIACATYSNDVRIYDAATLELKTVIWREQPGGTTWNVAWSPDGSRLATASYDVWLWRPDGSLDRKLDGRANVYAKFSWSPDGQQIACGDGADPKQVRIINLDGTPGMVFKGHEDTVTAIVWSPDGKQLVSSSWDRTVRVWNVDGTAGPLLKGHEMGVNDVDWSPDGKWIVSAGEDSVRLWKPDGNPGPVIARRNATRVKWHPDSVRFVVSSMNAWYTTVFDINGNEVTPLRDSPGGCVTWSKDGKQIVVGDAGGNILVWDDKGRRLPSLVGGRGMAVAWSSAGQLASIPPDGTLTFWSQDGQIVRKLRHNTGGLCALSWSPDGQYLLVEGNLGSQLLTADGSQVKSVAVKGGAVAWHPDSVHFANTCNDEISVWNRDGTCVRSWKTGDGKGAWGAIWSADGEWLGHWDGSYEQLPNLRTYRIDGTPGPTVTSCPVGVGHPHEPLLATLYPNLRLWRIEGTEQAGSPRKEPTKPPAPGDSTDDAGKARLSLVWSRDAVPPDHSMTPSLAWSPDGRWLATETGDQFNVRLYNVDGRRGLSFRGFGDVQSLSWSPDSRRLAMGLSDQRVAVCDAQTGQAVWIGVHLPGGEAAVFSGAGQLLRGQDKMNVLDQHLAYVLEHPDGRMEVVKPSQFPARAAELAKQVTIPEWAKPVPTLPDGSIDLMPLVEIKPDANPETDWTRDGQTLVGPRKQPNAPWPILPIPITLSGDYDLVVQAEAPDRIEGLFLLLQADGHPVESAVCLWGHASGLQLIDGQDVGQNETLLRESLLGQGQKFQLTCQVRRNQIRVLLDDRAIVDWKGEFERLTAGAHWGTFAGDGIFALLAHGPYRIHGLKLVLRSDEAKQSANTFGDRGVAEKLREIGAFLWVRRWTGEELDLGRANLPPGFLRVTGVWIDLMYDIDVPFVAPILGALPHISLLSLGGTDVSDDGLRQLPRFSNLRRFWAPGIAHRNPLAAISIDKSRLEELWIGGDQFVPEALDEIQGCSSLLNLHLTARCLTDECLLRLPVLPRLAILELGNSPLELTDGAVRHLARFEALHQLILTGSPANEERLMRLAELKQLGNLSLDGTKTTDRVLQALQAMPNLGILCIRNTPATEAGVKAFKAAKPNCLVEWSPAP